MGRKGLQDEDSSTPTLLPFLLDATFYLRHKTTPVPSTSSFLTSSAGRGTNFFPKTLRIKRRAFQILLQKCRELRTSETDKCKSPPARAGKEGMYRYTVMAQGVLSPASPSVRPNNSSSGLTQGPMGTQGKSQGICPTFRNPMREIVFL